MDPFSFLKISLNTDGSITRHPVFPTVEAFPIPTISNDVPLNHSNHTWIRLFLPACLPPATLPLIIYFHGGGFILFSAASTPFHNYCSKLSASLPALVLSVEYRLAPEHRLPAAYQDAIEALHWLREQIQNPSAAHPWLRDHADFSRCFLMGYRSGGNIAYRAAIHAACNDLKPLRVEGLIMTEPFFGGEQRTDSELRLADGIKAFPLSVNDLMWNLSLPEGVNREHEFCNPMAREEDAVERLPRCLFLGYLGDPLIDRQRQLVWMLERRGVSVVAFFEDSPAHGNIQILQFVCRSVGVAGA